MADNLVIHSNLELDDWMNFSIYHYYSQRGSCTKLGLRIAWIGIPAIYIFLAFLLIFSEANNLISVFLIILSILWLVLFPRTDEYFLRRGLKRALIKEDRGLWLGPQELTLTPEYILGRNEASEGKYKWKTVSKIEVTDEYIFIYVTAISAIIIPRRTTAVKESFDEIARLANEFWQMSNHS
jgi:hypothetical protein